MSEAGGAATRPPELDPWEDAALVARLLALDPTGVGGVVLRGFAGPVRDRWLALLRRLIAEDTPFRRCPLNAPDGRLLGGLDLAATLRAGRPVAERGLLAEADGGIVILAMAERLSIGTAARLAMVLDRGEVVAERDGLTLRNPARVGMVALDEGAEPDERPPPALAERLAFHLDLTAIALSDTGGDPPDAAGVAAARTRLADVTMPDAVLEALCGTALALGIGSARAPLLAMRVARGIAALAVRDAVTEDDAARACRLVFSTRATRLPPPQQESEPQQAPDQPPDGPPEPQDAADKPAEAPDPPPTEESPETEEEIDPQQLQDLVLAAIQAALPADVLSRLQLANAVVARGAAQGKAGAQKASMRRGRPIGTRGGELRAGARISLIETLRSAAPWQPIRRAQRGPGGTAFIEVRREDFRLMRFKQRSETVSIFAVDASGSAALNRLAEAKGAVEMLLADCYVRRDKVAVVAFRGSTAEVLLPPTNSLVRAKRSLAGLPGGGGTPIAAGIDAALALADAVRRRGQTPIIVLLTDGRANVPRQAGAGRDQAQADAMAAARQVRTAGVTALMVDTSPRPQEQAKRLAAEMGAHYLPLPYSNAAGLSRAVRAVAET